MHPAPKQQSVVRPHRAGAVFVLGVLSLPAGVFGVPLGLVPAILGWRDLNDMRAGTCGPRGRSLTQIGMLLGGVSVAVSLFMLVLLVRWGLRAEPSG